MTSCLFVSDLHGQIPLYEALFNRIVEEKPSAVFLGGDLLPPGMARMTGMREIGDDFVRNYLVRQLEKIKKRLGESYPRIFIILGNDDARIEETSIIDAAANGIWDYAHNCCYRLGEYNIFGYACVPPTPFLLKDWERYDVSRHVDPGCIAPTEGWRSVPAEKHEIEYGTIEKDLKSLAADDDLAGSIFLFHSPPYKTNLDRAALDGQMVDHVPLDVNIGSIAIHRFIKARQPLVTLHGHVHESARLTGSWQDRIGKTWCFSAAHDGPELSLVRFNLEEPENAARVLFRIG